MDSKTEIAEDVTNIAVKDMNHSVWFGSMRDSLWQRPKDGKRVISGQPARSPRSPTRIETDVQVSMLKPRSTRRMHDVRGECMIFLSACVIDNFIFSGPAPFPV
jgi:hypothetical protein